MYVMFSNTGAYFVPDAYCAMKASSKISLMLQNVTHSTCSYSTHDFPSCTIDTLGSIGHSLVLNKSSRLAYSCMQHYISSNAPVDYPYKLRVPKVVVSDLR